jgi:hypothetical protein
VIQRQNGDRADGGHAGAMNGVDVEAGRAAATQKRENPSADNRSNHAKQDVDDGSLARGADDPAYDQPQHEPQENPHDHRHSAPMTRSFRVL